MTANLGELGAACHTRPQLISDEVNGFCPLDQPPSLRRRQVTNPRHEVLDVNSLHRGTGRGYCQSRARTHNRAVTGVGHDGAATLAPHY